MRFGRVPVPVCVKMKKNGPNKKKAKSRVVINGKHQGNVQDTHSPTLRSTSLRTLVAVGAALNAKFAGGDFPQAYVNADNDEMIKRTKAVEFHCPSLVTSSYNQDGKQSGGSLAQVLVTQARGDVVVWQAAYDNSVPIAMHGGTIDTLSFSLTNQDGDPINLQSQNHR